MCCGRLSTNAMRFGVFLWTLAAWPGLLCPEVHAQPQPSGMPAPRLFSVFPPGGKAGTSFEIAFTGQDLEEPEALNFSHPGIEADPIRLPAPAGDPKKPPPPAPPVTKFKVTISANTPLGIHDVRLVNKWGISNPRAFVVGDLNEVIEKESNDDVPTAQRVEINTTINGVIGTPTDVDYFVFKGKRGQRVLASCLTSTIDSQLRSSLEIYDAAGKNLGSNRHYHEHDSLLDVTLPADADYLVRLVGFTHIQGGPEHFYRLSISTAPWIDAVVPLAIEPGKATQITVYGRNLPGGQLEPTAIEDGQVLEKMTVMLKPAATGTTLRQLVMSGPIPPAASHLDGFTYRVRNDSGSSNDFFLAYARAPVLVEKEPNDTVETVQEVTAPCEVSGRIDKRNDRDWYQFQAQKGEAFRIELLSARLGVQADLQLSIRSDAGKKTIVDLDDTTDTLTPNKFFTATQDTPAYPFVAPADGKYQLVIKSRDGDKRYGPRNFYHLRILREQPDFRLIILPTDDNRPEALCLRRGSHEEFTVLVWRQDGFKESIDLRVEGLPAGVIARPQTVAPTLRQASLVLSSMLDAPTWTGEIKVTGTAVINGQMIVREARPASITWPAPQNSPALSRLDQQLVFAVRERAPFSLSASVDQTTVMQGTKLTVNLQLTRLSPDFKVPVAIAPIDPPLQLPSGIVFGTNNQPITIAADKETATATLDVRTSLPPGTYTLALRGTAAFPFNKDPAAKQKPNVNVMLPATPLTITVVPKTADKK